MPRIRKQLGQFLLLILKSQSHLHHYGLITKFGQGTISNLLDHPVVFKTLNIAIYIADSVL